MYFKILLPKTQKDYHRYCIMLYHNKIKNKKSFLANLEFSKC